MKWFALLLKHIQKIILGHEAIWVHFAKYWIGLNLRKYNSSLASNNFPHSFDFIPPFYKVCLDALNMFTSLHPDVPFVNSPTRLYYFALLNREFPVKCCRNFPQIKFPKVFKNIFSSVIDPCHRNICYRLAHDVVYVNYYLYCKKISKRTKCFFCNNIETVSHLFLECSHFLPLNKIVLSFLKMVTDKKLSFSEKIFRFFDLPELNKQMLYPTLVILSISRYVIWYFRNLAKHNNVFSSKQSIISKFLSLLRYRIYVDCKRLKTITVLDYWAQYGLCTLTENDCEFDRKLLPQYYENMFR